MNPELKAKWVAALRSGEFRQVRGDWKSADGHCCVGVLLEISGNNPCAAPRLDASALLGCSVHDGNTVHTLINMNDAQRKTFPEIADWIEANL